MIRIDDFYADFGPALAVARAVSAGQRKQRVLDGDADNRAYFERACVPPDGYKPDGKMKQLAPPTKAQLDRHRKKFEPVGVTFREERRQHNAAVDATADLYGLNDASPEQRVLELRAEGLSVSEISARCRIPANTVKRLVRGGGATPSRPRSARMNKPQIGAEK